MNPVALLTPTYGRDLEICRLLCESVDRHVTSFSKHYLLVPDSDLPLFAPLASDRRVIIPASTFLPDWLRPLPRIIQRKRRQFWWSLRAKPVSGWHVQQLLKIAATITLPHQRYCILDSDIVFFRDFDLSRFEYPNAIPLLTMENVVTEDQPRHSRWLETSHQLLGLKTPSLPADDFIGHIIFWDQQTTRELVVADRGDDGGRLDRGAVPDPRVLRIHAVRLFRAERQGLCRRPHRRAHHPLRELLGRSNPGQARTQRSCSAVQTSRTSRSRSHRSPARRFKPSAPRSPRATSCSRRSDPPSNLRGSRALC